MSVGGGEPLPRVTVIMPVRNEAAFLHRSLGAVLAQDYPRDRLEILVVDGRSSDPTRAIVEALSTEHPGLHLLDNPQRSVAPGFNLALQQARGEVIVRVDGHTLIEPDYVRCCVEALERTEASNVGGRMRAEGTTAVGRAVARATSSRFGIGDAAFHYLDREAWVDTVYLGAWRRQTFERLGLFDEDLVRNQDDEFNYRLRASGGRILLCPKIRSRYFNRATLRGLFKQYFQYGLYKVRVLQKHPRQMQPRQFAPPLFVVATVLGLLAAPFTGLGRWLLLAIWAPYLLLDLAASWRAGSSFAERLLLLAIFPILHLAYGSGFAVGLLRFAGRWRDRDGRVPVLEPRSRTAPEAGG